MTNKTYNLSALAVFIVATGLAFTKYALVGYLLDWALLATTLSRMSTQAEEWKYPVENGCNCN